MNTRVVFDADIAGFRKGLQDAVASLLSTGVTSDQTKAKIVQNFDEWVAAAAKAGKSWEAIAKEQERVAARLNLVTEENAKERMDSADREVKKLRAINAELERMGRIKIPDDSSYGHGFTDRMASSAVVRELNGNAGIRSIENTLTLIPGFASAAQGLAPLIGAAGLTGLFIEMGEKGYEAFEKVMRAAQESQQAFDDEHERAQTSIDDLDLENQKLQDQIDKLSGHPNNGVATALLEAKKMADQLLVSLEADRKEMDAIFQQHNTGMLGKAMAFLGIGPQTTGKQETELDADRDNLHQQLKQAQDDRDAAMASAKDDASRKSAQNAYQEKVKGYFQSPIGSYQREIDRLKKETADRDAINEDIIHGGAGSDPLPSINNDNKIANLQGDKQKLQDQYQKALLYQGIYDKNTTLGGMKQDRGNTEADNKAAEARLRAMEAFVADWKTQAPVSAKAIFDYWQQQRSAFAAGSAEYNSIVEKQATIAEEGARNAHEAITKYLKETQQNANLPLPQRTANVLGNSQDSGRELLGEYAKAASGGVQLQAEMAKTRVEVELANGSISKFAADQQLAAIAAEMHAQQLRDLNQQIADLKAHSSSYNAVTDLFADDKEQKQYVQLQFQVSKESTDAVIDRMKETSKLAADTWTGALRDANALWVQDAQNTAQQVAQLYQQTLNGLNENLVNGMFGEKTNWSGMFKGIGKSIAGDGLKHLEAAGLKSLGVAAKADGSKSNPFYVVDASGASAATGAGLKSLGSLFGAAGSGSSSSSSSGSSGIGNFIGLAAKSAAMFFGGGFALGGDVQPGVAYDVGEMGRERFVPKVPGTIIPNNQLGGGGAHYTLQVANGVAPEQMHMYVQAALQQFHPRVVRDSVHASMDRTARLPSSRG